MEQEEWCTPLKVPAQAVFLLFPEVASHQHSAFRQTENKPHRRSFPHFALNPDAATMGLHYFFCKGEPEPTADRGMFRLVQP